ncbi:unnamed protein product, partial [Onchocerca ochengi]
DQKEAIVAFQEEGEPTTISAKVTIIPVSGNEVTLPSEVGTFEGQKFTEVTENDIVGAVADIIANIPSNVPKTKPDMGVMKNVEETNSMLEESFTETIESVSSSVAPEIAITESHIKETSETDVISLVAEESASTESSIEMIQLKHPSTKKILSNILNEPIRTAISVAEEASTSMNGQGTMEVTSRILSKTSEEGDSPDEAESVSNIEQSFVQENVDDIMGKVVQSTLEENISVTNIKSEVTDETVGGKAIQVVTEASNVADILVKQGDMTTEPPVQAVSDLISVLSQNSKIEEVIRKKENVYNLQKAILSANCILESLKIANDVRMQSGDSGNVFYSHLLIELKFLCILEDAFVVSDFAVTKNADDQIINDIAVSDTQRDSVGNPFLNNAKINPFK